ncbi:MAG: hypothetical protein ABF289_00065 [Clostridiales bacterium]
MIKNYLYTIGKYLPSSQKSEILKEIESNLYDFLEENYGNGEYTDKEIEIAIKALGQPKKIAESYLDSPRYIIGSAYIDAYWLIIKIVLISNLIGQIITSIFLPLDSKANIQFFIEIIAQIFQSSMASIGVITLIFIVINKYYPKDTIVKNEDWSLDLLEKVPLENEKIKKFKIITRTFFILIFLVAFNKVSMDIGVYFERTTIVSVLNMNKFSPYIIWINILLAITLLYNIYLLIKGKWDRFSRKASIFINFIMAILVIKITLTPKIWNVNLIAESLSKDIDTFSNMFKTSIYFFIIAFVIMILFNVTKHIKILVSNPKKNL